ncbi:hypothetical protein AJ78_06873 [Emergomyces pasteurianus Ep9510]|uniref:Uncharacterized protein n=1 Tax=Emergomyces pasteurianus Ep9510 TaxID=1447872 RepID=A0A1J9P9E5_9EURO|nr:hypothetical protein AJ78_06873 [Emergomyces pasteurianus Ep9510]
MASNGTTTTPTASLHDPPDISRGSKPSSTHLDSALSHFTDPAFDPVEYLNNILPPLSLSLSPSPPRTSSPQTTPKAQAADFPAASATASVSLASLSTQTQSLVSQLSAQNARLSNTLTQLTDEILRGGGRLAYEVEVLRGEAVGLVDALGEGLEEDIGRFVPGGKILLDTSTSPSTPTPTSMSTEAEAEAEAEIVAEAKPGETIATTSTPIQTQSQSQSHTDEQKQQQSQTKDPKSETELHNPNDPLYLTHLRTLTHVRARLEEVIHTFGEAMEWPLAPSETSLASSFISVSAPEPGSENQHSREEKGKEVARKIRAEIAELLSREPDVDTDTDTDGVEAASQKVEALRELAGVWKGTAEEKARMRFVEGLAKMVEERRKVVQSEKEKKLGQRANRQRGNSSAGRDEKGGGQEGSSAPGAGSAGSSGGAAGLLRNLQRLRDEIYLD